MRFGLFVPPFGALAHPRLLAELAVEAEEAGWDGVFLWDHVYYRPPAEAVLDPWTALAAIATVTNRVAIGAMVTPLPRRRPQVLARQYAALDLLSDGRLVIGAGLGLDTSGGELSRFGEELDAKRRATMLDESLDLIDRLLRGEPVDHDGEHYRARDVRFLPTPAATPRPPVWLAARWPNRAPLRRAARYDGVFVIDFDDPAAVPALLSIVDEHRPADAPPFQVVVQDRPGTDPKPWRDAGAAWWLTRVDPFTVTVADVRAWIADVPRA